MWPATETHRFTLFGELFIIVWSFGAYSFTTALKSQHVGPIACRNGVPGFELVTGYAYTTSSDLMRLIPGSLELTQCLTYCQMNNTCKAINYETGLCILLSMGGTQRPEALKPAQFPVFTIYAEKLCLKRYAVNNCNNKAWVYERIIGYKLKSESKKTVTASTRERCAEMCLRETDFDCRAVNYNVVTGECVLLDHDRHSFSNLLLDDIETGLQADPNFDYLENNCIHDPSKVCEFKRINGLILKTVDSIHPDITSIEDCKKKCLTSPYRCHSFDFGDGTSNVCRTSHLNRASAVHIQDPYLEVSGAATYELDNCYNVSLHCGARGMRVKIKMDKPFTGKIYATSKPNSCYNLIKNQYDFDISMPYNDINCGIMQTSQGRYSNSIVIQHHELIVTSNDIGLSINCQYDLSTKKIAHNILLTDMGDNLNEYITRNDSNRPPIQETPVTSPTVTMRITDRDGNDIKSAEIGDFLSLRFEIPDDSSPYEIFVREVIADDGVDTSEFTLIDEKGCPTDISIMSGVRKVKGHQKSVEAPFEAFKFPTSGIVQFRALVVPCLPTCEPVICSSSSFDGTRKRISSLGRRRRDAVKFSPLSLTSSHNLNNSTRSSVDNELIVIQALEIVDKFPGKERKKKVGKEATKIILSPDHRPLRHQESRTSAHEVARALDTNENENFRDACMDINNLVILCLIFLIIQFVIITVWGYIKYRHHHLSLSHQYFAKKKVVSNPSPISASPCSPLQKIVPDRSINRSFLSLEDINILV